MHPVIGYKDLLAQVTRDEMMEYYKSRYFPNNMVLAVAGNVKADEVLPKIKEMFKSYPRKPYISAVVPQEPDQISPRRVEDTFETDLTQISIGYPSVGMLEHDLYALDVLAQILGQGESSRLYKSLTKEKKLVQYISATNFTPVDQGVFEVEAVFEDESKAEEVIEESLKQIELIKTKGITKNELKKALQQVLSDYIFSNQTTERVAWTLAYDEAFTGNHQFSANYVKEVGKVTPEDIKRVANKYLTRNTSNIIVLRPKKGLGGSEVKRTEITAGEIKKEVLPNGLIVLTREDPQFEIVSIRLNLRGGLYEEPSNINGAALLMADVWTKGTKSRTAEQIAELTDSKGIALTGSSGRNSNGVYLDCLSQDWELCMDLLKEIALSPAFPQEEMDLMKQQYSMSLKYRDKDIFRLASFHLQQNLFDTHPLRLDTRGTEDSLARISRDDLVNFYKRVVVPNNMVISVFGNIDAVKVTEKIKKDFGRLERRDIQLNSFTEKALEAPRHKDLTLDKEQAIIQYGFRGVSFNNPDFYALDVLTCVLGSSFSGRMFTKIRDTYGKAYTLGGDVVASVDAGYVYFYVLTDDKSIEDVDRLVREEIKKIQKELVSEKELQDTKRFMKGIQKSGLQTNAQQNSTSSLNELYHLGYDYHLHYDEFVDKVTREDVMEAANKYFDLEKMVTIYVRPEQKAAIENDVDIIKGNE
jgi:zinc protease